MSFACSKKQIRSSSRSAITRHNNRLENEKRKNDTDTESKEEITKNEIQIRCVKRKLKNSIKKQHRIELFQLINSTVSTMFLITHHIINS